MTNTLPTFGGSGNTVPCFTVAGPLQIWGNTGTSFATEFLGWTRSGIEIQEQAFIAELKSDYAGGEQGMPDDFQYLGMQHIISAELARFNTAILAKYERRMNASITTVTIGALLGCSTAGFKVLFLATNFARLYTRVYINEPIGYAPIGSAASFPRITFTGLGDPANTDGSPWNSAWSVSGAAVTFT